MAEQTVLVGPLLTGNGISQDSRREVCFEAEELGSRTEYGQDRDGQLTDTRGVTETLYKTPDGRFVVHVKRWSHGQGEPTVEELLEIKEADLEPLGDFGEVGAAAGFGRPLTLDEGLGHWEFS